MTQPLDTRPGVLHLAIMSDSLTLILEGEVTLEAFAEAIETFRGLVSALSDEVSGDAEIKWIVTALSSSSAVATVQGVGDPKAVDPIVRAYERTGECLEASTPIPYSRRVRKRAERLTGLITGGIESIRLETDQRDVILRQRSVREPAGTLRVPVVPTQDAYGTVEGMVETLSRRRGLRFTLYDIVYDKAVSCYLAAGYEDIMRDAWGKRAVAFGHIHRDPLTGRPLTVRQITDIEVKKEGARGDWRKARGAFAMPDDTSSEDAIRTVRDG